MSMLRRRSRTGSGSRAAGAGSAPHRDTAAVTGPQQFTTDSGAALPRSDRPASVTIIFDRRDHGTRQVRTAIAEHCAERIDPELVGDAQLVASELLTNALEHGAVGLITVGVTIQGAALDLSVTSTGDASRLADPEAWMLPEPESVSGRGLAITRAIARAIDVRRTASSIDGRDWIEIVARLEPGSGRRSPVRGG